MYKSLLFFLLPAMSLIIACGDGEQKEPEAKETQKTETNVQQSFKEASEFNSDSAYYYIEKQVLFGSRVPNSKEHAQCAEWLKNKLASFDGWEVQIQEFKAKAFDDKILNGKNIIASFNKDAPKRILLFAHWDTRPFADQDTKDKNKPIPGANDGGSGVGVLLEIARQISLNPIAVGVDIVLFDAEDYGQPDGTMMPRKPDTYCLGSQHWAKNPHVPGYRAYYGILLDMVGAKDATFTMEATSMYYASNVVEKVWAVAHKLGYGNYFLYKRTDGITDDHYYVNAIAGIPSIDIIQHDPETRSNFGKYWHTHDDNMNIIDRNTLKAVGQTLLQVLYNE
jgi:Zn-dependent M28 family amino/carboxypeptidase